VIRSVLRDTAQLVTHRNVQCDLRLDDVYLNADSDEPLRIPKDSLSHPTLKDLDGGSEEPKKITKPQMLTSKRVFYKGEETLKIVT